MEIVSNTATKSGPLREQERAGSLAEQFCISVRDQAAEARYAFQAAQLKALAQEIDVRLVRLEQRSAELKEWIARREAFSNKATEHLVGIIAVMRPEAASAQLIRLDAAIAAAILSKLAPRVASAILNEMPPDKAAMLTTVLAASANNSDAGEKR
ncbi:MAG: MotE family protein [Hyphomicrobiaceae bacterium]